MNWPIEVKAVSGTGLKVEVSGVLKNISARGALASLASSVPVGTNIDVFVRLPLEHEQWMNLPGEVVRVDSTSDVEMVAIKFATSRPEFMGVP